MQYILSNPCMFPPFRPYIRWDIGRIMGNLLKQAPRTRTAAKSPCKDDSSVIMPVAVQLPALREGPLVGCPDAELVERSIEGDMEAYAELVARYQHAVRNLAKSMVGDYQDAEDLAQETFIKAFSSLNGLKERDKFSAWLFTILRHTALDFLRSNRDMVSLETLLDDGFEPGEDGERPSGTAVLEAHEEDMRTLEALRGLRDDYREVIVLKHVEKLSYKEISKRLNMSVSAVGEKLSRVRALLKRRLEKQPVKTGAAVKDGNCSNAANA